MVDFTRTMTMWGSDEVIHRWGRMRSDVAGYDPSDPSRALKPILEFEQLMIAMRRDVGYPETAMEKGDLIRMYADDDLYKALIAESKR